MENQSKISFVLNQDKEGTNPISRTYTIPRKYDKQIHKTTQIPRVSILRLIAKMDQDNDGWIIADDLIKFSAKHYLFFEEKLAKQMIEEAMSSRIVAFKEQLVEPINVDEILGAVHIHYRLDEEHKWVEKKRPYREQWIQLLLAAGEKLPQGHDLQPLKIDKILDMHEISAPTYKPKLNNSKSQSINVSKLSLKPQFTKNKPEAGIELKQTEYILPINTETPPEEGKDNPFEKVVNQRIRKSENQEFPTIGFESQIYYKEAERLSRIPKECATQGRHPIYKFLPEHHNYGVGTGNRSPKMSQEDLDEAKSKILSQSALKYRSQPLLNTKPYYGLSDNGISQKIVESQFQLREEPEKQKPIFLATFQPENVHTLKHRMAKEKQKEIEMLNDFYIPASAHRFRDEYVDSTKPLYKTRLKPDPLPNPHMMSEHDQRPQFAIEQEMRQKMTEEMKRQSIIDDYMGTFKQTKNWVKYFPTADLNHNFVDMQRPKFLEKGSYQEPGMILLQFLREGASSKDNFQLFHRALHTTDKHTYLGIQLEPNS